MFSLEGAEERFRRHIHSSDVPSGGQQATGTSWNVRILLPYKKKIIFNVRVVEQIKRLPRENVDCPSLEKLKI